MPLLTGWERASWNEMKSKQDGGSQTLFGKADVLERMGFLILGLAKLSLLDQAKSLGCAAGPQICYCILRLRMDWLCIIGLHWKCCYTEIGGNSCEQFCFWKKLWNSWPAGVPSNTVVTMKAARQGTADSSSVENWHNFVQIYCLLICTKKSHLGMNIWTWTEFGTWITVNNLQTTCTLKDLWINFMHFKISVLLNTLRTSVFLPS